MEQKINNIDTTKEVIKPTVDAGLKEEIKNNPTPEEKLAKEEKTTEKVGFLKRQLNKIAEKREEKNLIKGEVRIQTNPKIKAMFEELQKANPEKAHKLQIALGKYEYVHWNEKKQDYEDTGRYTEFVNK